MYKVPFPPRLGAKRQGGELPVPTWIQNDLVDSEAMYSAFLQYLGQCSEEEQKVMKERVNLIQHKESECVILGGVLIRSKKVYPSIPLIRCTERDCKRCRVQQGGYKFRWYSHQWLEAYVTLMRKGSWDPRGTGEPL